MSNSGAAIGLILIVVLVVFRLGGAAMMGFGRHLHRTQVQVWDSV